jgi:hypothetical protein
MWSLSLGLVPEAERIAENPLRIIAIPAADGGLTSAMAAEIFGGVMDMNLGGKLHDAQAVISETPLGTLRRLAPTVTYSKTPPAGVTQSWSTAGPASRTGPNAA